MSRIHDALSKLHERGVRKRLCKEVGRILSGADVWHDDFAILDALANKEVPSFNMFHAVIMFGVVGHVYGALVVALKLNWA